MIRKLEILEEEYKDDKFNGMVIYIDGKLVKTKFDLFNLLNKYIKFPDYFANNRDSFWDVITDDHFIKENIRLIIYNYDEMFLYSDDKNIFCKILIEWLNTDLIDIDIIIDIIKKNFK